MIPARADRWIHFHDLATSIPGREDDDDMIHDCWDYLVDVYRREHLRPDKVMSEILAARVVSAVETSREAESLNEIIRKQAATIDRLLAFVPSRARRLPPDRVEEIVAVAVDKAQAVFGSPSDVRVSVSDEEEQDSDACHRIVLRVSIAEEAWDPVRFVTGSWEVQKAVAASTEKDELEAIRLIIEPADLS